MQSHKMLGRWLGRSRGWLSSLGPIRLLTLLLACLTAGFAACLSCTEYFERGGWIRPAREEKPPEAIVDRLIRVRLLGRKPVAAVQLSISSEFTIADPRGTVLFSGPARANVQLKPRTGGGILFGEQLLAAGDVTITPKRDASIVVNERTYRGTLRIERLAEGLVLINQVDIEAYLRGVLRGELPRFFHPESFKAQCVAARGYSLYQKQITPPSRDWDVTDDEGSQMYVGVAGEDGLAVRAVTATRGEVLVYDDGTTERLLCTYYSSACGGRSQHVRNVKPNDPDAPPLAGGVVCDDCYLARFYRWAPVKISKTELTKKLTARYPTLQRLGTIAELKPKALTPDGRIIRIELLGSTGQAETLIGEDFRLSVGGRLLKSTNFKIKPGKNEFIFSDGKGFGHGMGLCQYGMETKARRGMPYDQILRSYYPGAQIKKLYE